MPIVYRLKRSLQHAVQVQVQYAVCGCVQYYRLGDVRDPVFLAVQSINRFNREQLFIDLIKLGVTSQDIASVQEILCRIRS